MDEIRIGFIPLVDCALVAVAHEQGYAARHDLRLILSREPSWAALSDRVAFGLLDAAHMLAPMPAALSLGLGGRPETAMEAPLGLGRGGNAITLSAALAAAMNAADPAAMAGPPATRARALAKVAAARRAAGEPPPRLASVHPFSCHDYQLRLWLEAGGMSAEQVEMMVIPPPRMVEYLANGQVDGFCVGEPWNLLARTEGIGMVVATQADIAPAAPEKVLGVTRAWAEAHPDRMARLIAALTEAAAWAAANPEMLARLLARPAYVGVAAEIVVQALVSGPGEGLCGRFDPVAAPVAGPARDWLLAEMRRRHHLDAAAMDRAAAVFEPTADLSCAAPR
jgi:ABC-type nitrate/sulfonate/bicarbonate transport system substrate-binding protein